MVDKQLTEEDVRKIVKQELKGKPKQERPLSPYQKHMSVCLKKDDKTFKDCIDEWNEKKD